MNRKWSERVISVCWPTASGQGYGGNIGFELATVFAGIVDQISSCIEKNLATNIKHF